jgi:Protein of unknown function (DUF2793)
MPDPFSFDSKSPRYELPMLFPGQAQKEAWVNEALARLDAIVHCTVEGERPDPPASPAEGEAWLIGTAPTGSWTGKSAMVASRQAGNWLFVAPRDGMRIFDRSNKRERVFSTTWKSPEPPAAPTGGAVIDAEARTAITQLIAQLRLSGLFPET